MEDNMAMTDRRITAGPPFWNSTQWGQQEDVLSSGLQNWTSQYNALKQMRDSMEGDRSSVYASWMIGNQMTSLKNKLSRQGRQWNRAVGEGQTSAMNDKYNLTGLGQDSNNWNKMSWDERDRYNRFDSMASNWKDGKEEPESSDMTPPIPEWMQKFFTNRAIEKNKQVGTQFGTQPSRTSSSKTGEGGTGEDTSQPFNWGSPFAPLSAQQDLNPDQIEDMMAYFSWAKAGRPTTTARGGMEALQKGQEETPKWFDYFAQRSQALFPQQRSHSQMQPRWRG